MDESWSLKTGGHRPIFKDFTQSPTPPCKLSTMAVRNRSRIPPNGCPDCTSQKSSGHYSAQVHVLRDDPTLPDPTGPTRPDPPLVHLRQLLPINMRLGLLIFKRKRTGKPCAICSALVLQCIFPLLNTCELINSHCHTF